MSLQPVQALYTVEDYLALERASAERHEYLDGRLSAMAGESPEHGHWELFSASGLSSSLSLDSIACTLRLADVYERIVFPAEVLEAYPEEPPSIS